MSGEENDKDRAQSPPPTFLFTLRVWKARVGEGQSEWRGRLQSVTTGEVRYFRDWQKFVALLREMLDQISFPS